MTIEYKLPDLGEDIETGDVIGVYVGPGDSVSEDQPLLEIETDKAAIEIPSPSEGTIKEVHVNEGDTIKVGQLLVTIDDGNGNGKDVEVKEVTKVETQEEIIEEIAEKEVEEEMNADPEPGPDQEQKEAELSSEETEEALEEEIEEEENVVSEDKETGHSVAASPSVRRLARELGIDIESVKGTGPGGRISEDDLRNAVSDKPVQPQAKKKEKTKEPEVRKKESSGAEDSDKWGNIERTPMSKVRRLTAERLTQAWTAPHVTQYDKADITDLEKLRKEFGPEVAKEGGKLTMTSIILKVIASALKNFPQFNASVDMESGKIIYKKYYNIGVAVDTERGLLVPVIKDCPVISRAERSIRKSEKQKNLSGRASRRHFHNQQFRRNRGHIFFTRC